MRRSRTVSAHLGTRGFFELAGSLLILACAPEPTKPADSNLGGVWTSSAHLFSLSQFKLTLIQEPAGIVSGGWAAKGDGGGGGCLPETPCDAYGFLIGRNMVSKVELELLGAGKFEGTLVEPNRMRGIFAVGLGYDTITFTR